MPIAIANIDKNFLKVNLNSLNTKELIKDKKINGNTLYDITVNKKLIFILNE
jgi:hypothetical protein